MREIFGKYTADKAAVKAKEGGGVHESGPTNSLGEIWFDGGTSGYGDAMTHATTNTLYS